MPIEVLLVEDSPGDVRLTREAFRDANQAVHLHVATDGVDAMAFLRRQGPHADAPRPDIILLDLNLPRMDGREVLVRVKEDAGLKLIPTVILTTSDAEADIVKSYELKANCYLSKPVRLEEFENLVKSINDFWLTKAKLPPQKETEERRMEAPNMPLQVLLVEDSPGDVRLTREAFRDANSSIQLHVVQDGVEAMAFLKPADDAHLACPRPDLILLDLNLPRMDGREVLAHIKEAATLKTIPTVILTTSDAEADIARSYELQANCYLTKPVQLDDFESLVSSINDFWLTRVRLPQQT